MKIFKYPIEITDKQEIMVPMYQGEPRPEVIHVGLDPNGFPCVWLAVHPDGKPTPMTFHIRGTGHEIPSGPFKVKHVGSFNQNPFMWHVFMEVPC